MPRHHPPGRWWPDRDELLAEVELEYTQDMAALADVEAKYKPTGGRNNHKQNVNARMWEKLHADSESHGRTCGQWAEFLGRTD